MCFSDRINSSITQSKSIIVAGFDPILANIPKYVSNLCSSEPTDELHIFRSLNLFYEAALEALNGSVAAVKPNIAFFEQYGVGGIRAFQWVCASAKERGLPVIVDAKRGDIGTTAEAYRNAYFKGGPVGTGFVDADALTVSPFLGFDTLTPFLTACAEHQKGIFVLVRTSNPGAAEFQGLTLHKRDDDISGVVARWVNSKSEFAMGRNGLSGIGAVVGATTGEDARRMRHLMPNSLFLIPGMGAQGGSAEDALQSFLKDDNGNISGGIINLSRSLMSNFTREPTSKEDLINSLKENATKYNDEIAKALIKLKAAFTAAV